MSLKFKNKKRFSKKNRRIWNVTRPTVGINRGITFADRQLVRLGYFSQVSISGAISGDQVYNLNGCFDPDQSGTGHQPGGYDQWAALYSRYLVHRVRYHVVFAQISTASCTVVGCAQTNGNNSALTATQQATAIETVPCQWTTISLSPAAPKAVFRGVINIASLAGATPERYKADDRYQALTSANPSEVIGFHTFAHDFTGSTNVSMSAGVRLEYEVEFFDRIFQTQSLLITDGKEKSSSSSSSNTTNVVTSLDWNPNSPSYDFDLFDDDMSRDDNIRVSFEEYKKWLLERRDSTKKKSASALTSKPLTFSAGGGKGVTE